MLGERVAKPIAHFGGLIGIVDLVAAEPFANPRLRHALRVAQRDGFRLKRQIACRRRAGVEVLVVPKVGGDDHRALLPIVALRLFALGPHQTEAFATHDDDVGTRPVGVRFFVGANWKLRDVAIHAALGHREANMATACTSLLGRNEREIDRIGDKVSVEQQSFLLALVREVFRLAVKTIFEVESGIKDKPGVTKRIDHHRSIRHGHEASRLGT